MTNLSLVSVNIIGYEDRLPAIEKDCSKPELTVLINVYSATDFWLMNTTRVILVHRSSFYFSLAGLI